LIRFVIVSHGRQNPNAWFEKIQTPSAKRRLDALATIIDSKRVREIKSFPSRIMWINSWRFFSIRF